jgi:hypothetical protein
MIVAIKTTTITSLRFSTDQSSIDGHNAPASATMRPTRSPPNSRPSA